MAESDAHKERVAALVDWMTRQGVTVTEASGGLALPDPGPIGRHEPDAIGTKGGVIWIGEAKIGNDLGAPTSQEQFADFSNRQMTETRTPCPFILCVPQGFGAAAERAVIEAGGSTSNLTVIA
ncbi:MAG TPA: hypothetical protein VFO36_04780 [Nitrospiraceae bacterium]|nr:hypothetical protein [Nitrospiraceae bacterium]